MALSGSRFDNLFGGFDGSKNPETPQEITASDPDVKVAGAGGQETDAPEIEGQAGYRAYDNLGKEGGGVFQVHAPSIRQAPVVLYPHLQAILPTFSDPMEVAIVCTWGIVNLTGEHLQELPVLLGSKQIANIWEYSPQQWPQLPKREPVILAVTVIWHGRMVVAETQQKQRA